MSKPLRHILGIDVGVDSGVCLYDHVTGEVEICYECSQYLPQLPVNFDYDIIVVEFPILSQNLPSYTVCKPVVDRWNECLENVECEIEVVKPGMWKPVTQPTGQYKDLITGQSSPHIRDAIGIALWKSRQLRSKPATSTDG